MRSASQYEADLSEGSPWFREDPDTASAVAHVVGRVILRYELDLLELRVRREKASADLVDEVLDRAAVELVEDAFDLVTDGPRPKEPGPFGHPVLQIAVAPVHVHMDRERSIRELGKRRVVVTCERRERAPRCLDQRHAFPTASRGGDLGPAADHVYGDLRDCVVAAGHAEQHLAGAAFPGGRVERHLARGHAQRLHHRICLDEATAEERAKPEERGAFVLRRHRVHEVLHRVGGDDFAIVALRVCGHEALSENVDVYRRREWRDLATAEPVERYVCFPVADLGRGHDAIRVNRSRAMARNSSIPVASSSSRLRLRRSRNTGTISAFERPPTNTTKRNLNLRSYSSFSEASSRSVARSAPPRCSRRESAESDAGSAPMRGCAFSTAMRPSSVIRAISDRAEATIDAASLPRTRSASPGARSKIAARSSGAIVITTRGSCSPRRASRAAGRGTSGPSRSRRRSRRAGRNR